MNDGTAIALFTIIYAAVTSNEGFGIAAGAGEFLRVAGLSLLPHRTSSSASTTPMMEITLTMLTAYGSFVIAEGFHASGVIATVTAGMVCGSYAAPRGMSATTRGELESFREYVAFALNSLVILPIGLEVRLGDLVAAWAPITIAFLAVTVGRAAIVFAVSALLQLTSDRIPWRWSVMLTWGGLCGALSVGSPSPCLTIALTGSSS